jgi:hypothetical protein
MNAEQLMLFDEPAPPPRDLLHWRFCWPEWDGPKVGELCNCGECFCFDHEAGAEMFHYCAPVRVTEVVWGEKVEGVIDYPPEKSAKGADLVSHWNGRRVRLPWSCVWPPTKELWKIRNAHN